MAAATADAGAGAPVVETQSSAGTGRLLAPGWKAQVNDVAVLYQTFDRMDRVYLKVGETSGTRFGTFHHNDLIGRPWGIKVTSRDHKKWAYLLPCTAELYTMTIPKRTQVLYHADIGMVLMQLDLAPGKVVVESGTGSGSLTVSLARAVAPTGHVHSFEYNAARATAAASDMVKNGLDAVVTVRHGDALAEGFPTVGDAGADAVFLDLPAPWDAMGHAGRVLGTGGRLCSFSPCVEQVHRAIAAMQAAGFDSICTMEVLVRPWQVVGSQVAPAPLEAALAGEAVTTLPPAQAARAKAEAAGKRGKKRRRADNTVADTDAEVKRLAADTAALQGPERVARKSLVHALDGGPSSTTIMPMKYMRGHTAYLTFATKAAALQTQSAEGDQAAT